MFLLFPVRAAPMDLLSARRRGAAARAVGWRAPGPARAALARQRHRSLSPTDRGAQAL